MAISQVQGHPCWRKHWLESWKDQTVVAAGFWGLAATSFWEEISLFLTAELDRNGLKITHLQYCIEWKWKYLFLNQQGIFVTYTHTVFFYPLLLHRLLAEGALHLDLRFILTLHFYRLELCHMQWSHSKTSCWFPSTKDEGSNRFQPCTLPQTSGIILLPFLDTPPTATWITVPCSETRQTPVLHPAAEHRAKAQRSELQYSAPSEPQLHADSPCFLCF